MSVQTFTTWLEVACVVLLVAAAGVLAWPVSPAAGLAAAGVASGVASPVLTFLTRPRGRG